MEYVTYATAKAKVERELDIQDEDFVDDDELMGYFNDAIDKAEAIIQTLFEDYFLTSDYVDMTETESSCAMPTNIYASKIRKVVWRNGNEIYEVVPIKIEEIDLVETQDDYRYLLENDSAAAGVEFVLYPPARETTATKMRRWYIRNANRIAADADLIDIPEHMTFIYAFVKREVCLKEGHPRLAYWIAQVDKEEGSMREDLKTKILDGNTFIQPDMSFYDDFGFDER